MDSHCCKIVTPSTPRTFHHHKLKRCPRSPLTSRASVSVTLTPPGPVWEWGQRSSSGCDWLLSLGAECSLQPRRSRCQAPSLLGDRPTTFHFHSSVHPLTDTLGSLPVSCRSPCFPSFGKNPWGWSCWVRDNSDGLFEDLPCCFPH